MSKQYKTTAEVATLLKEQGEFRNLELIDNSVDNSKEFSDDAKDLLSNPEFLHYKVSEAMSNLSYPIMLFNFIGNGPDYDYSKNKKFTEEDRLNSLAILTEEVQELGQAIQEDNKPEIVDALNDIIYVAVGLAVKSGLLPELNSSMSLVCHNNLLKFKENSEGLLYADRINGKIQKPEGFEGLDLSKVFPYLVEKEVSNA